MKHRFQWITTGLMLALVSSGCAGWRSVAPPPEIDTPNRYLGEESVAVDSTAVLEESEWWTALNDTLLNDVMERAFTGNLSLQRAVLTMKQARALERASRSSLLPWLTLSANQSESDFVGTGPTSAGVTSATGTSLSGVATASYEVDLFGGNVAGYQGGRADRMAAEENLHATVLSLSAQIARSWYTLVALQQQQAIINQTVQTYQSNYEFIEQRFQRGTVTSLDLFQAKTSLESALAQQAENVSSLGAAKNSLAVLLGEYPGSIEFPEALTIPKEFGALPVGLPSDLLQRRPDIRSAYYSLVSADRAAAEAAAARYPSFSLTGTVTGNGVDPTEVLDIEQMIWKLAGNLTAPLFAGGQYKANADFYKYGFESEQYAYELTLLTAFQEVEDALLSGRQAVEALQHYELAVESSRAYLKNSMDRYTRGTVDYFTVATAQTSYLNSQLSLISGRRALIEARITLVTALGGGWTEEVVTQLTTLKR